MNAAALSAIPSLPEADLRAFKDALAELLDRGSILGFESRTRELYHLAAGQLLDSLKSALFLHEMDLINDDERLLLLARPLDSCPLLRRFDQTETLFVLALWKTYDEHRQAGRAGAVILTLDDFFTKLKSWFPEAMKKPVSNSTYDRALRALQRRNLVRYEANEQAYGRSEFQVLPTVLYVVPFPSLEAWASQAEKFQAAASETEAEPTEVDEPQ